MIVKPQNAEELAELCARAIPSARITEDGIIITTHCMYPSNGLVRVRLRAGREVVVASDDGEALGEVLAAGLRFDGAEKLVRHIVRVQGLTISGGVIYTPQMPIEAAPLGVLLVANAARDVAQWLYDHKRLERTRDFRRMLTEYLSHTFAERVTADTIVGMSNKPHKFANVVKFPNGKRLIVDAVANEPSSINARVVANLDIKAMNDPGIEQRIVYDDTEKWSASDLNLLQVGAVAVPFSHSAMVIKRLAEQAEAA